MRRIVIAAFALAGCDQADYPATLYRNSATSPARIHVATFDANESGRVYNLANCAMAARLYNANLHALNPRENPAVGFWCEPGEYAEKGAIPGSFLAAFPTDTP